MIRALTAGGEEDGYDDDMNTIALFDELVSITTSQYND